jgi:hypothetical protein
MSVKLDECVIRAARKETKLISDSGDSGSKKYERGYGDACEYALGKGLKSGGRSYVGAFGRNRASVAMKKFSYLIYFLKTSY